MPPPDDLALKLLHLEAETVSLRTSANKAALALEKEAQRAATLEELLEETETETVTLKARADAAVAARDEAAKEVEEMKTRLGKGVEEAQRKVEDVERKMGEDQARAQGVREVLVQGREELVKRHVGELKDAALIAHGNVEEAKAMLVKAQEAAVGAARDTEMERAGKENLAVQHMGELEAAVQTVEIARGEVKDAREKLIEAEEVARVASTLVDEEREVARVSKDAMLAQHTEDMNNAAEAARAEIADARNAMQVAQEAATASASAAKDECEYARVFRENLISKHSEEIEEIKTMLGKAEEGALKSAAVADGAIETLRAAAEDSTLHLRQEMEEVQAALAARQRELYTAEELREEVLQRVSDLEAALSKAIAQKAGLETQVNDLSVAQDELRQQLCAATEQLAATSSERDDGAAQLSKLSQSHSECSAQLAEVLIERDQISGELAGIVAEAKSTVDKIEIGAADEIAAVMSELDNKKLDLERVKAKHDAELAEMRHASSLSLDDQLRTVLTEHEKAVAGLKEAAEERERKFIDERDEALAKEEAFRKELVRTGEEHAAAVVKAVSAGGAAMKEALDGASREYEAEVERLQKTIADLKRSLESAVSEKARFEGEEVLLRHSLTHAEETHRAEIESMKSTGGVAVEAALEVATRKHLEEVSELRQSISNLSGAIRDARVEKERMLAEEDSLLKEMARNVDAHRREVANMEMAAAAAVDEELRSAADEHGEEMAMLKSSIVDLEKSVLEALDSKTSSEDTLFKQLADLQSTHDCEMANIRCAAEASMKDAVQKLVAEHDLTVQSLNQCLSDLEKARKEANEREEELLLLKETLSARDKKHDCLLARIEGQFQQEELVVANAEERAKAAEVSQKKYFAAVKTIWMKLAFMLQADCPEVSTMNGLMEQFDAISEELVKKFALINDKNMRLASEISELSSFSHKLEAEHKAMALSGTENTEKLQAEVKMLSSAREAQKKEIADLNQVLDEQEKGYTSLLEKQQAGRLENHSLTVKLSQQERATEVTISSLRASREELESLFKEKAAETNELKVRLEEAAESHGQTLDQKDSAEHKLQEKEEEICQLREKHNSEAEEAQESNNLLLSQIEEMKSVRDAEHDRQALTLEDTFATLKERGHQVNDLQTQLTGALSEVDAIRQQNSALAEELEDSRKLVKETEIARDEISARFGSAVEQTRSSLADSEAEVFRLTVLIQETNVKLLALEEESDERWREVLESSAGEHAATLKMKNDAHSAVVCDMAEKLDAANQLSITDKRSLEEEIETLKRQASESVAALAAMKISGENETTGLCLQLESAVTAFKKITGEKDQLKRDLHDLQESYNISADDNANLHAKVHSVKEAKKMVEDQLSHAKEAVFKLEANLSTARDASLLSEEEHDSAMVRMVSREEAAREEVFSLEVEVSKCRGERDAAQSQIEYFKTQVLPKKESELESALEDIVRLDELLARKNNIAVEVAELSDELEQRSVVVRELREKLCFGDEALAGKDSEISLVRAQVLDQSVELGNLQNVLSELEQSSADAKSRATDLESDLEFQKEAVKNAEQDLESRAIELCTASANLEDSKAYASSLEQTLKDLDASSKEYLSRLAALESDLVSHREEKRIAEDGLVVCKEKLESVQLSLTAAERRANDAEASISAAQTVSVVPDEEDEDMKVRAEKLFGVLEKYQVVLDKNDRLRKRAKRFEALLHNERKKTNAAATYVAKSAASGDGQKMSTAKRQISPSAKGLSPSVKRAREAMYRSPLSPAPAKSRPPLAPREG